MATPSIQTLITQAQQVLNLQSSNEIRATLAAVLANANVGTPLNPNLTTQQLWDEFDEIVRQSTDDIMSIITDQMMRMVFSPPAPGGAGADKQVIFNDGGVLAGDTKFLWDKTANRLDVDGPVVITGAATVGTTLGVTGNLTVLSTGLIVNTTGVGVGVTPSNNLHVKGASGATAIRLEAVTDGLLGFIGSASGLISGSPANNIAIRAENGLYLSGNSNATQFILNSAGNVTVSNGNVILGTSGKGIDFGATANPISPIIMTSELLDDYEEGTFTPVISTGATAVTYSVQTGRYTKVGRIVEIHIQVTTTAATRDANQFIIGGLPFSSSNFGSGVIGYSNSGFVSTAGGNKPNLYVSLTGVEFYNSAGGSFAGTTIANDAFDIRFSATYFV